MSVTYCSTDGCFSKVGSGISFFRCPKDKARCQLWKNALGFTGNHKYANITPEQCHCRIRVCSLHFASETFTNDSQNHIRNYAVPSLRLPNVEDNEPTDGRSSENPKKNTIDAFVQTDSEETGLSLGTLEKTLKYEINTEDVVRYLENNYSEESCKLLKAQLNFLNTAPKGCQSSDDFKLFALTVYFLGPKAYKKFSTLCRLPSKAILQRFTKRWTINPGFNDFIFRVTELRVRLLKEKDCIISVDEMPLKSHLFYDISNDKIIGFQETHDKTSMDFASSALVIMAQGVACNWKQPIAYFFYKSTATSDDIKDILFESVRKLFAIGLNVLGVVSNQQPNFQKLVENCLKLTEDKPFFFVDNKKLVYLFDVNHLLKSTRNNFFSYIFKLANGETNKSYLETMYNYDKLKEYRLCPKLTDDHIYPNNSKKMKVKYATQVFSHSVAVALNTYIDFNILPIEAKITGNFVHKMNNLFDILNSCHLNNLNAFMGTEKQIHFLKEMITLFEHLTVVNSKGKSLTKQMKFIFGWKLTIKGILVLWDILTAKGYTFLLTRNLNQDCLENFFGQVRNCCSNARNPTPIQFCRAFKKIFALTYFDHIEGANCMKDVNEVLLSLTPEIIENCKEIIGSLPTKKSLKVFTTDYKNLHSTEGNALVYVTEYILKKCLLQHSCEICRAFNNFIMLENVAEYVIGLENLFVQHFNEIACRKGLGSMLKYFFMNVNFNHPCVNFPNSYLISLYIRVRIYYAIKFLNRDIKSKKTFKPNPNITILKNL